MATVTETAPGRPGESPAAARPTLSGPPTPKPPVPGDGAGRDCEPVPSRGRVAVWLAVAAAVGAALPGLAQVVTAVRGDGQKEAVKELTAEVRALREEVRGKAAAQDVRIELLDREQKRAQDEAHGAKEVARSFLRARDLDGAVRALAE